MKDGLAESLKEWEEMMVIKNMQKIKRGKSGMCNNRIACIAGKAGENSGMKNIALPSPAGVHGSPSRFPYGPGGRVFYGQAQAYTAE